MAPPLVDAAVEVATEAPRLTAWSEKLTCYTAALGEWLARERGAWWRPLVAGGPILSIRPHGGYLRFHHNPASPAATLGLELRTASSWPEAEAGIEAELERAGRVVVAADGWALPWHPAYGRRHLSHWLLAERRSGVLELHDPLELLSEHGNQKATRVVVRGGAESVFRAELDLTTPERLREAAALGCDDPGDAASYRWLVADADPGPPAAAPDETPAAIASLADYFERHAGRPHAYEHLLDVWQAARQRALVVAALEAEAGRRPRRAKLPDVGRWRAVAAEWAELLPFVMYAGMLAAGGTTGASAKAIVERLRKLATMEAELSEQRFPQLDGEA